MTEREVLKISAVDEVLEFDEQNVTLSIGETCLTIGGTDLSVSSLSLESGEVTICGKIDCLLYQDAVKRKKGFSRFFGA